MKHDLRVLCRNWETTNRSDVSYVAALDFALRTHRDLVDGMFPSFVHLNCTAGTLPTGLNGHGRC